MADVNIKYCFVMLHPVIHTKCLLNFQWIVFLFYFVFSALSLPFFVARTRGGALVFLSVWKFFVESSIINVYIIIC